jgi:hypothetical protein
MLYSIHTYARLSAQPDLAVERGREPFEAARGIGDRWLVALTAGGMSMTYSSFGAGDDAIAWLERAAVAAMTVPSPPMAIRMEMWRGACAATNGNAEKVREHFERAADLAGMKSPAMRAEAYCALAIESCKIWARTGEEDLLDRARSAAMATLDAVASLPANLPWESVAHSVLAVVADKEDRPEDAANESRIALSTLDGITHVLHFLNVLWATGRVLIRQKAPEAEDLAFQIAQGLGYLSMTMTNPDIKAKWFAVDSHHELAKLVGFEISDFGSDHGTSELEGSELEVLRAITSGSAQNRATADDVAALLTKLGVASETEAIEYAIKAGVSWQ